MGGCASKPRESADIIPGSLPSDAPAHEDSPKKAEAETVAPEKNNGGEIQKEEPLVDLSEPTKQEASGDSESKSVDAAEAVVAQLDVTPPNPIKKEQIPEKQAEEKVLDAAAAKDITTEPKKKEPEVAATADAKVEKPAEPKAADKPAEVIAPDKPAEPKAADKPAEVIAPDKPAEVKADKPAEPKAADKPAEVKAADKPAEVKADKPPEPEAAEKPAEVKAADKPAEAKAEKPAEAKAEKPAESVAAAPSSADKSDAPLITV